MALRKWIVRSLVFTATAALALAGLAYYHWTNAPAVRQLVLRRLGLHLPGANVHLSSARLRLMGGISLADLQLSRVDDPAGLALLQVPSGAIFHDKEKLLHGEVAIRKLEWYQPTIRVVRDPKGKWNLSGILAPPQPDVALPMIELRDATILLDDQQGLPGLPPLEVRQVRLTIINDPHEPAQKLSTLKFSGSGYSPLLGPIHVTGILERTTDELKVSVQMPNAKLDRKLAEQVAQYHPAAAKQLNHVQGQVRIAADFHHLPTRQVPWSYQAQIELVDVRCDHPSLPLPVEHAYVKARCLDGRVVIDHAEGNAGPAKLLLRDAEASDLTSNATWQGTLLAEGVPLTEELFAKLPGKLPDLDRRFKPRGDANLSLSAKRVAGEWALRGRASAKSVSGVCQDFAYPVDRVSGYVDFEHDPAHKHEVTTFDLVGYSADRPISIQGSVKGSAPACIDAKVFAKSLPIDAKLRDALPLEGRRIVEMFHATGLVDAEVTLHRPAGQAAWSNNYLIQVHEATLAYEVFPYQLEHVSGMLELSPTKWEFRDFQAQHGRAQVVAAGSSVPVPNGRRVQVAIRGRNVALDAELQRAARQPGLQRAWQAFRPRGQMDFRAEIDIVPGQEPDIEVRVTPRGTTVTPGFFPYELVGVGGEIRYRGNEVELSDLCARHGGSELKLRRGKVLLESQRGMSVDLVDLVCNPIVPDRELVDSLPPTLQRALLALGLSDPLSLKAQRLTIHLPEDPRKPPYLYWDGGVRLNDARLCAGVEMVDVRGMIYCQGEHHGGFGPVQGNLQLERAVLFGQPVTNISAGFRIEPDRPDVLKMPNLQGKLYGGDLGGAVQIRFDPELAYAIDLHASQLRLEEMGRDNKLGPGSQLQGIASARLFLEGSGMGTAGLRGHGRIDVPSGKMYNLPLLLDLLKVLNGRLPDKTMFEEARMQFAIQGPRAQVSRLDLYGNAVSISGEGSVNLDGTDASFDCYAVWGRLMQWLPGGLDRIPAEISKNLLKIKLRGNLGKDRDVIVTKEPLPAVVEPILRVLQRRRETMPLESANPPMAVLSGRS